MVVLVVKPILDLHGKLPRIHIMRAAEGIAVIEQVTLVGKVQGGKPDVPLLPKRPSQGKVVSGVRRQMLRTFPVEESRSVADIEISADAPWDQQIDPAGEGVALVMIEEAKSRHTHRVIRYQSSTGKSLPFRMLPGVGQVELGPPGNLG